MNLDVMNQPTPPVADAAPRSTDLSREGAAVWCRALTRSFVSGRGRSAKTVQALPGIDLAHRARRGVRPAGPQRRRQDHGDQDLQHAAVSRPRARRASPASTWCATPREVRRRIGLVSGGENSGYGILNVRECLWMFSQFYGVPSAVARGRASRSCSTSWACASRPHTRINRLSTGQRQRMNFARGFVSDPEILFLDEPTLGMDVTAARALREYVARVDARARPARTVLLTTHYMAEADELCDRIAIIDRGRVLACDTPPALRRAVQGGQHVELELRAGDAGDAAWRGCPGVRLGVGRPAPGERGTFGVQLRLPTAARSATCCACSRREGRRSTACRRARPRSRTCSSRSSAAASRRRGRRGAAPRGGR